MNKAIDITLYSDVNLIDIVKGHVNYKILKRAILCGVRKSKHTRLPLNSAGLYF